MPSILLKDRARITVSGEDASHFLQSLITTDLEQLGQEEWKPGALLTAQGKVQFAFLLARAGQDFLLEASGADMSALAKRLGFYKLRSDIAISAPDPVEVCVAWDMPRPDRAWRDIRFRALDVWRSGQPNGNPSTDESAWNALRIAHGVAEPGADFLTGDVFAHDINLDQTGGLSFRKGCYVGQEVVSRMHHRGTARRRVMVAKGLAPLQPAVQVFAGDKPAGTLGTAVEHAALALVRLDRIRDALDGGQVIRAGDVDISLSFPQGASFGWPQGSGDSE